MFGSLKNREKPLIKRLYRKIIKFILIISFLTPVTLGIFTRSVKADSCCSCLATTIVEGAIQWFNPVPSGGLMPGGTSPKIWVRVFLAFYGMKTYFDEIVWKENLQTALMLMAEQSTAVTAQQALIIGQFMDAKHQMETQQLLQTIHARAHKDYHPSPGMCTFATQARSLAASERKSEVALHVLAQRSQDRYMGQAYTASASGEAADIETRLQQYRENYCDPQDNAQGLTFMCETDQEFDNATSDIGGQNRQRLNKDIDYVRTLEEPMTISLDLTNENTRHHAEDVMALSANLYAHNVFRRFEAEQFESKPDTAEFIDVMEEFMDKRAVLAKMNVAETSFNTIAAMKSEGAPGTREFIEEVLTQLGVDNAQQRFMLMGDYVIDPDESFTDPDNIQALNPSYYAQMEILGKKLYQHPDFYTNLYDKPANIDRKYVAMQAIALMQKFDLFKSHLRNEANLSVLLELEVSDMQKSAENEIGKMGGL